MEVFICIWALSTGQAIIIYCFPMWHYFTSLFAGGQLGVNIINMATNKTDHDILIEIHTILLGANGQDSLCRKVEKNTKAIAKIWIIIAIILASLGGGGYGVLEILRTLR